MPRIARLIVPDQKTVYHVMSRTALDGFPFGDVEKEEMVKIIARLSRLYFTEVLGFCIMGNHFHLLVRMIPGRCYSDEEIKRRFVRFYGETVDFSPSKIPDLRNKWERLSEYMKEIKQTFSLYYNKRHDRRGTLWGERFKSLIVQDGAGLINCLAYIDLNPLRAGLVERPEEYRWNSIGYHIQSGNRHDFLSLDFGLGECGVKNADERLEGYRRYLYEAGSVDRSETGLRKVIDEKIIDKERKRGYRISRSDRFLYRSRYFTDSGIIGSRDFVFTTYQRFKTHLKSKKEKLPRPIAGLDGMYCLKRMSEA